MSTPTWTTSTGKVVLIREMDDKHLVNALNMMLRRAREAAVTTGRAFMEDRVTQEHLERTIGHPPPTYWMELDTVEKLLREYGKVPQMRNLVEEVQRRGLFHVSPHNPMQLLRPGEGEQLFTVLGFYDADASSRILLITRDRARAVRTARNTHADPMHNRFHATRVFRMQTETVDASSTAKTVLLRLWMPRVQEVWGDDEEVLP